ncbi:transmembrane protease serine 11D-like [Pyxicephalus adspersus]
MLLEPGVLMKSRQCKITIAVIAVTIFIIVAAVVAAVVITVILGNKSADIVLRYYKGSFTITNVNYRASFADSDSADFKALSVQIERLTKATFQSSALKDVYKMSKVVNLGSGTVEPTLVVLFQVPPNEMKNFSSIPIQNIFRKIVNVASRSGLNIDMDSMPLTGGVVMQGVPIDNAGKSIFLFVFIEIPENEGDNFMYGGCGVGGPTASSRIVGGVPASSGSWPWQASMRFNGKHKCGASLISNTWLISAAHCFDLSTDPNKWTVALGSLSIGPGFGLPVKRIIVHEAYTTETRQNDIALLELSDPVNFKQNIRTICLPQASDNFPDGSSCYVTGWGALEYDGSLSPILRQAEVKIINSNVCGSPEMYGSFIKPVMLCAGYLEGKIDACQGDSGGPLVSMKNTDKWFLIGVISFGEECALQYKPGVYSRITFLRSWIKEKTGL